MLRNYYTRWFLGGFLFGAAFPTIVLLGLFGWHSLQTHLLVRQMSAYGQPVVIVTNPFIDFTNPATGASPISGVTVFIIAIFLCGFCAGFLSLGVAALNRHLQKRTRDY